MVLGGVGTGVNHSDLSPRLLLGLAQMAEQRMPDLSPRLASSVFWALARLGFLPDAHLGESVRVPSRETGQGKEASKGDGARERGRHISDVV